MTGTLRTDAHHCLPKSPRDHCMASAPLQMHRLSRPVPLRQVGASSVCLVYALPAGLAGLQWPATRLRMIYSSKELQSLPGINTCPVLAAVL